MPQLPAQKPDDKAAAAEQASLDKAAEKAEEQADAAQGKADELAADAQKAEEKAEDHGEPRAARCPTCRERLERYRGDNPHKEGTHWCPNCGRLTLRH